MDEVKFKAPIVQVVLILELSAFPGMISVREKELSQRRLSVKRRILFSSISIRYVFEFQMFELI